MTTNEFAQRLNISRSTVLKYRRTGRLVPSCKDSRGNYIYTEGDIAKAKELFGTKNDNTDPCPVHLDWQNLDYSFLETDTLQKCSEEKLLQFLNILEMFEGVVKCELHDRQEKAPQN